MAAPKAQDVVALQLAAALEQVDLEVARLQLDLRDRKFIANAREHLRTITALCEELAVPEIQQTAFANIHSELLAELTRPEGKPDVPLLITYHRKASHALRETCISAMGRQLPE